MTSKNGNSEVPSCVAEAFPSYKTELGSRIAHAATRAEGVKRLAEAAGISESQIYRYISGTSIPSTSFLLAISLVSRVPVQWLAIGEGPKYATEAPQQAISDEDFALVPLYDVCASAGHGAQLCDQEAIRKRLAFRRDWIREMGAQEEWLCIITVDGDSMEPTLRDGGDVLVDLREAQRAVPRDGIYIIRMDGALLIKRIQRQPGRLMAFSDNPAYPPFPLDPQGKGEDAEVLGRVIWHGHAM